MSNSLIDTCIAVTGRTYGDGYGFALAYLTDDPGPDHLKAIQEAAWAAVKRQAKNGNPDAAAFVSGYVEGVQVRQRGVTWSGWQWWLIEAAQLVHADALGGNRRAGEVLRMWGLHGY